MLVSESKEWTREECENLFVTTDVSLLDLSNRSQVDLQTLYKWSFEFKWVTLRKNYQTGIIKGSKKIAKEKTIDKLADRLSEASVKQFESYESVYLLAKEFFDITAQKLQTLRDIGDIKGVERAISLLDAQKVELWSRVLERGINGSRKISGADYEDINVAIAQVEKVGLKISKKAE